jgi:phage tail sheath protein FI
MGMNFTYPGVYIEELSSGVHTITGVATSIAALVGWAAQGPAEVYRGTASGQENAFYTVGAVTTLADTRLRSNPQGSAGAPKRRKYRYRRRQGFRA